MTGGQKLDRSDKAAWTKDKDSSSVKRNIPGNGSVRVGEATPGVLDHFIRNVVETDGPSAAHICGAALSWMFMIALRQNAVSINTVLGISVPKVSRQSPRPMRTNSTFIDRTMVPKRPLIGLGIPRYP